MDWDKFWTSPCLQIIVEDEEDADDNEELNELKKENKKLRMMVKKLLEHGIKEEKKMKQAEDASFELLE